MSDNIDGRNTRDSTRQKFKNQLQGLLVKLQ